MDRPSLAWGRDDTIAAPAAWVPWSQRVSAAPDRTRAQMVLGGRGQGGLTSTLSPRQNFCLQVELNIYTYIRLIDHVK